MKVKQTSSKKLTYLLKTTQIFARGHSGQISKYLKVIKALVELAVGQGELPLDLCILISGCDWIFMVQLSTVEVHVVSELLILLWNKKGVLSEKLSKARPGKCMCTMMRI